MSPRPHVLVGPCLIGGGLSRIIEVDGREVIESFSSRGWTPGGADRTDFWEAPPASPAAMSARGIPPDEIAWYESLRSGSPASP